MLIQIVLLVAVAAMLVYFVRRQHGVRLQAGKRIAFFAFVLLNAYAVLRPDEVTRVAHTLGVGRGADLMLYLLVVTFVFVVLNFYLRMREMQQQVTELARQLALRDAEVVNRNRGLIPRDG